MVVDLLWLRFSFLRSASDGGFGFPCTCDIQLEHKRVTVCGLILCFRSEFEVRRIRVQWDQGDTMSKDFVLDHGSIIPDICVFDSNCRDLVYGKRM